MTSSTRRPRVPQRRIAESVAAELRERIFAGDEPHLPAQDLLAAEFGVSQPSIREALRILETEGLVTVRRGAVGGAEVHRPDGRSTAYHLGLSLQGDRVTLGDLAAGLRLLEPLCAAECARRDDRAQTLVPLLEANLTASWEQVDDRAAFGRTAHEFHDLLLAHTPNSTLRSVVASLLALWSAQEEMWTRTVLRGGDYPSPDESREIVATHRELTEHIAAGRAEAAEELARAHLAGAQEILIDHYDGVVNAVSAYPRRRIDNGHRTRI